MSDPHNPEITGYHEPTPAELSARGKRSFAIAAGLFAFVAFVFVLMLYKLGIFS